MKKEYFNIPNLLGYFRILMIPVFLVLYYKAETPKEFGIAFFVLALTFLSDFFDGKIARKFNMVTDFGKVLDPIADKLTQFSLAIAVTFHHSLMKLFLGIFVIRELYMGLMGLYLLKKKIVRGAKWFGKICTGVVDIGVFILLLFPQIPAAAADVIIFIMIGAVILAMLGYMQFHIGLLKEKNLADA